MIDFDFIKDCCGCGVCVDTCPKNCIKMVRSPYGYLIPSVNQNECINCNQCNKVCPTLNTPRKTYDNHQVFSAFNKNPEIRAAGSSGSVFYLMATTIISKGGVVYGAAFDENLQLQHVKAETEEALSPLLKSKYIQSNTVGVFQKIKQDLIEGRTVLFVGTPCQTCALYNIIPDKYQANLYIIDFICHGVPSQELFNRSIRSYEKQNKCHVDKFTFRVKGKRHSKYYQIEYTDKRGKKGVEKGDYSNNPYYRGYMLYNCFRQSCYRCKHVGVDRVSDLTIADFWGITQLNPSVKDQEKGYSMVITNSEKGKSLFGQINENIISDEYTLDDAIKNNSSYTNRTNDTQLSKLFRWSYNKFPYWVVELMFFSKILIISKKCGNKMRLLIQKHLP